MNHWDEAAEGYDNFIEKKDYLRAHLLNKAVLDLFGNVKGRKVLDAGCGQGYFSNILSKKGAEVLGIDYSEKLIEIAKDKYFSESTKFEVHDLKNPLPFKNSRFDCILCNMVLMDFDPIEPTLNEFYRVLSKNGSLVLSIPHPAFFTGKLRKDFWNKVTYGLPHYEINRYKKPYKKMVKIKGLSKKTPFYHRPMEFYISSLIKNGFEIKAFKEPVFDKNDKITKKNNFLKLCIRIPPYLIIKAKK